MKLFSWEMFVNDEFYRDGYLIAYDREEAIEKLWYLPCANKHKNEEIYLTDECGHNGIEIDEAGFIIRKSK